MNDRSEAGTGTAAGTGAAAMGYDGIWMEGWV